MDNFVDLFMVSPLLLVVLFFVAMLAGFIDALAGGGGLLTVPALLAAGMSPAQALATNKLQACGGSLSASLYFIRRKVVSLADQKLNILMTFIGSTAGALLVLAWDVDAAPGAEQAVVNANSRAMQIDNVRLITENSPCVTAKLPPDCKESIARFCFKVVSRQAKRCAPPAPPVAAGAPGSPPG